MEIDLSTSCKNPFWQYLWDESIKKLKAFAFSLTQLCDAGVVVFFSFSPRGVRAWGYDSGEASSSAADGLSVFSGLGVL